jgi:catechol 2,3-dioxygenase-like lactoylglutathione lyase family enzyme
MSHLGVRVRDLEKTVAWYERVLGYQVFGRNRTPAGDEQVFGMAGGLGIEFITPAGENVKPLRNSSGFACLSFSVEDIDAAHAALAAGGYTKWKKPLQLGDSRLVLFRDPEGNLLEVIQHPKNFATMAEIGQRALEREGRIRTS